MAITTRAQPTYPIFNQLEAAANNPNVRVVAVWDRLGTNDSAYYKVWYDTDLNRLAPYTANVNYWPRGELNMGDPETLVDFVSWARTNYPARHYALILSNHGNGLGGGMLDDTSNGDHLTVSEMGAALASATLSGTNKIDVLYLDACLMGMIEDAYQVRGYVDYYVASENIQWAYSTPYFRYVSDVTLRRTPAQLAASFTRIYADVGNSESDPYTVSAANISRLSNLVTATNSLAQLLNSQMTTAAITLTTILSTVQRFEMNGDGVINPSDDYIDLYDFARLVKLNFPDSGIQVAAQGVMDAVNDYVLIEHHRSGTAGGHTWNLDNSHGVSVFFPSTASSFYNANNYDFATGAMWHGTTGLAFSINQAAVEWGPMLVSYFQITQPDGPDNPVPPQPLPRRQELRVYLPIIIR